MTDNANDYAKDKYECYCNRHAAVCLYCGYEDSDLWDYKEGESEVECPSCGKEYTVIAELVYTTEPKGGWPDE